jgi:hypothetical protein
MITAAQDIEIRRITTRERSGFRLNVIYDNCSGQNKHNTQVSPLAC